MKATDEFTVKVRPALIGYVASVAKRSLLGLPDDPFWMGWSPEPSYWRPTEKWAIRRAQWKRDLLEEASARERAKRHLLNRLTPQVSFTRNECAALVASLSASCMQLERTMGRNNDAWIQMNSLRTLFAEMSYGLSAYAVEEAG